MHLVYPHHHFASCFGSTDPKMCHHEAITEEPEVSVQTGINSLYSSTRIKVGIPPADGRKDKYTQLLVRLQNLSAVRLATTLMLP